MTSAIENCISLDELFDIWEKQKNHNPKTFVKDGIISNEWGSKKKILFILKEAYLKKDKNGEVQNCKHDVRAWLSDENNFNSLLKSKHAGTWRRIIEWSYGINETNEKEIAKYLPNDIHKNDTELIKTVAVMNLKKSGGKSRTNMSELNVYAKNDRDFIARQIELISPDVIVCGSTLNALDINVYGGKIKQNNNDNWFYYTDVFTGRETLVLDYYHPSDRYPNLLNYYAVTNIYQQALLSQNKK